MHQIWTGMGECGGDELDRALERAYQADMRRLVHVRVAGLTMAGVSSTLAQSADDALMSFNSPQVEVHFRLHRALKSVLRIFFRMKKAFSVRFCEAIMVGFARADRRAENCILRKAVS
jgi:hypothetical protein